MKSEKKDSSSKYIQPDYDATQKDSLSQRMLAHINGSQ